jgi:hypothetical protein
MTPDDESGSAEEDTDVGSAQEDADVGSAQEDAETDDERGTGDERETDDDTAMPGDTAAEFPSIGATTDEATAPSEGVGGDVVESADSSVEPASGDKSASAPTAVESKAGEGLGWRGWVLVGGLVVAMVLVPWALVFLPAIQGFVESIGLGLRDAYLVLPMLPALGLGLLAVWAAIRSRQSD